MEGSDVPACEVEKQLGLWFVVGEITDKQRSPHWHESGHRCGSHDSTSEREDSNLVVAMRNTPVAGRPADAAADDAPTVRHAVERREVIVVPASSGAPLQAGSGEGVSATSSQVPNLPKPTVRGHNHHRLQWKAANIPERRELTVLVLAVMCLWMWHKLWNRQRGHTLRWRSMMKVSFQRDSEGDPRRTAGQVRDHPNTQLVVQALNWGSRHQAGYVTCEVMSSLEEVPPPPPLVEPPPLLKTSEETDAMMLAAVAVLSAGHGPFVNAACVKS